MYDVITETQVAAAPAQSNTDVRTYRRPTGKFSFRKLSLKMRMCCSLVKSTWLAMFCMTLHMRVRPRFMRGVGCLSIMPDLYGDTATNDTTRG